MIFFFFVEEKLLLQWKVLVSLIAAVPLRLCPDVGALSAAVRSTWDMGNMPFNKVRAKNIALCFTSLLLMHYHCPSTMKKQKV